MTTFIACLLRFSKDLIERKKWKKVLGPCTARQLSLAQQIPKEKKS